MPPPRSLDTSRPSNDVASQTARALISIRDLVLRGEFPPGRRISEIPLGERLGMSRTPIRLALERLSHMGLLHRGPGGGFLIREFTIEEVRDSIELRGTLEGMAARLAAERLADSSELHVLRNCCDKTDNIEELSIDSFQDYMDQNEAFHVAMVALAKSDMLQRMIEHVNSLPFASPNAMVFPTSMLLVSKRTLEIADAQHRALIEAIQNREGTRAEHLAREHARIGWEIFQLAISDKNVLSRVPGGSLIKV